MIANDTISLSTKGFADVIDLTDKVLSVVAKTKIQNGLATVFCTGC
jgi:thiamine phosphate synthase YjbQ (UPF0047 family)